MNSEGILEINPEAYLKRTVNKSVKELLAGSFTSHVLEKCLE